MTERKPERDTYDAAIELFPWSSLARTAFAVVKRTYAIREGRLVLDEARPLALDIRDPSFDGKWPSGSDFWPFKLASDVVVLGKAYAPGGRPIEQGRAWVTVGRAIKAVNVYGDRVVEWTGGGPRFGAPAPWTEVPLDLAHAYGGCDGRVMAPLPTSLPEVLRAANDHPGSYPRNVMGRGYVVIDAPPEEPVILPNLEDPFDLLTPERLVTGDPRAWYAQPIPRTFGWSYAIQFPRCHYIGMDPWHPVPDDVVLPEVLRGMMPEGWRAMRRVVLELHDPEPIFYQEASPGMTFTGLVPGTPFAIGGMHPERELLRFELPAPPRIEIEVEGDRQALAPSLLHAVIRPDEERVELTWSAVRRDLPRAFLRGLHGHIPLAVVVDGDRPIEYVTPEPILAQVRRAAREGRIGKSSATGAPSIELGEVTLSAPVPRRRRDQHPPSECVMRHDVDVASGRLVLSAVDFAIGGELPLSIARNYSSAASWRTTGALGPGWSHPFESAVWIEGDHLMFRNLDGREVDVAPLPGGSLGLGERKHCPTEDVSVRRVAADAFDVLRADGHRFRYVVVARAVQLGRPERARLSRIVHPSGQAADLRYDVHGRLAELVLTSGLSLRFEHDARGRLTTVFAPTADGRAWVVAARYGYDARGLLVHAVDGAGREHHYRYRDGLLVGHAHPSGQITEYEHEDASDGPRCTKVIVGGAVVGETIVDEAARVAVAVDAHGNASSLSFDPEYRVVRVVDVLGREDTLTYEDLQCVVIGKITPDGQTRFLYDRDLRLAEVIAPDGATLELEHDDAGHLTRWVDADGGVARWVWDAAGRLGGVVDRTRTSVIYDHVGPDGPLATVAPPGELRLALRRDPRTQLLVAVEGPLGARTATRDALGRIATVTDELGATTRYHHGPDGRLAAIELPTGVVRVLGIDAGGHVLAVSDGATTTTFTRDARGRVSTIRRGTIELALHRDAEGHVTRVASEAGAIALVRDGAGRAMEELEPNGETRRAARDDEGRIMAWTDPGSRIEVRRDAGRLVRIEGSDRARETFEHSRAGRVLRAVRGDHEVRFERDGEGRTKLEQQGSHAIRSTYDVRDERVAYESSLGLSVVIQRDARGEAASIHARQGEHELAVTIERDGADRERAREVPGGIRLAWRRDAVGRALERAVVHGERLLASARYEWRGLDRLARREEPARGVEELVHDGGGRLLGVRGSAGVRCIDDAGSAIGRAGPVIRGSDGRPLSVGAITYRYDAAGRRVERASPEGLTRYAWDSLDRLAHVVLPDGRRIAFEHDAFGRRVARRVEVRGANGHELERETRYVWDGLTLLHAIDERGLTTWLWERGALIGVLAPEGAFAALHDPLGHVTELVGADGELAWRGRLDPFGALSSELARVEHRWGFHGHYLDEELGLGLALFGAYDPECASYLAPSPLGAAAGPRRYAYLDDPVSERSPLGIGPGYEVVAGEVRAERLPAERLELALRALDRSDGAAGPRSRFDAVAARVVAPDPEADLWGVWERYRPERQLPPPASGFFHLFA